MAGLSASMGWVMLDNERGTHIEGQARSAASTFTHWGGQRRAMVVRRMPSSLVGQMRYEWASQPSGVCL